MTLEDRSCRGELYFGPFSNLGGLHIQPQNMTSGIFYSAILDLKNELTREEVTLKYVPFYSSLGQWPGVPSPVQHGWADAELRLTCLHYNDVQSQTVDPQNFMHVDCVLQHS